MLRAIAFTQVESLFRNHQDNPDLPIMTRSVVIEMLELEKFIMRAKNTENCDAIKIYLIRYPLSVNKGHIEKTPNNNLSQISLAFVPANITNFSDWTADDIKNQDNTIFTLLVCDPTSTRNTNSTSGTNDKTGLCPPKGNCNA